MSLRAARAARAARAVFALVAAYSGIAAATPTSDQCADSAEHGQAEWKLGHLLVARSELRICGISKCPRVVRDDCTTWVGQLDAAIPTVLFVARNERGEDVLPLKVTVDGHPVPSLATALELDPGSHVARFDDGRHPPQTRTFILREGEKRRTIEVQFAEPAAPEPAPAPLPTPSARPTPASTWIFGGIGVAALAGFAVVGLTGLERFHDLQDECRHTRVCSADEIGWTRAQLWIADGLGVAGIAALALAGYMYLARDSARPSSRAAR
jgi:hypothetical protein